MMKKSILLASAMLLVTAYFLRAGDAVVMYVDGWVDIKDTSGSLVEAWEGDPLYMGESIITDSGSFAELEKEDNAAVIKIAPDTVFTLGEIDEGGEKRTVLSTAIGSVSYKFNKTFGREPYIATPSIVAGVRGTEFTVFAGADGSTLVAVESGQVDVSAGGETVELYPEEGVEVRPGEAPGEKFEVLRGKIDYSDWNSEKFESFLSDPAEGARRVKARLETFIEEIEQLQPEYEQLQNELEQNKKVYEKKREEMGKDGAKPYYKESVEPLMLQATSLFINLRYYALSSLSLRRFVLGRLALEMKSRYIVDRNNSQFISFQNVYAGILEVFEKKIVPWLVEADI
jgi:hypothetical protein